MNEHATNGRVPAIVGELLGKLDEQGTDVALIERALFALVGAEEGAVAGSRRFRSGEQSLELLTNREEEILELLAQRLRDKEIAARLFISPLTVNSHLKSIYQKLGVRSRRQAAARARELGLLSARPAYAVNGQDDVSHHRLAAESATRSTHFSSPHAQSDVGRHE